jgi:hypothetical protein
MKQLRTILEIKDTDLSSTPVFLSSMIIANDDKVSNESDSDSGDDDNDNDNDNNSERACHIGHLFFFSVTFSFSCFCDYTDEG